jgi:hypothetical protein
VTGRKLLVHFAERLVGALIFVLQDVVRREIVQRFFRPALRRELVDQPADDAEVIGVVAELAGCDGVEEQASPCRRLR